jgi:hypothetical protein
MLSSRLFLLPCNARGFESTHDGHFDIHQDNVEFTLSEKAVGVSAAGQTMTPSIHSSGGLGQVIRCGVILTIEQLVEQVRHVKPQIVEFLHVG